ncbi:HlyD family secretion protein [Microbacter margulisiae]|uniref:HlyD family secretion protein n=1 Tax=Microbacter margulisiae TaxID=1350067 RepID=A0A7W5H382_9PORP|nr:HlyD family efflux transporter periplasmic adaptor subunit [Microbacter margulisiae]MBB3188147.1 HlyD family secretion protein [Microbacter margulisiae]
MKTTISSSFRAITFLAALAGPLLFTSCHSSDQYDAQGTFEATEVIVSSEASGKILAFNIDEGKTLTANQQVGCVDSLQLYYKKMQLEASLKAIRSSRADIQKQIAATEQQIATAKVDQRRYENLLKANAATQKQVDDQNSLLQVLRKQLAAQLSNLEHANSSVDENAAAMQFQIDQLNDQLHKCKIINPIHGTVLTKYAEQYEVTAPGKPLYIIANVDTITLRAYVTSDQLTKVKLRQPVKVYADWGEGMKEYPGVVTWISDKAEFTPKTIQTRDERANLVYAVKIDVKNNGYLKIGMYGEVRFN